MRGNQPPADVLLLLAVLLLVQAASAAYSGRVAIRYGAGAAAAGTSRGGVDVAAEALMRRRLEDEVAPELMGSSGSGWTTAGLMGGGGTTGYDALKRDRPACPGQCPGRGEPYHRGCEGKFYCRNLKHSLSLELKA